MAGRRPGGVTLVAILVWIQGLVEILLGVVELIGIIVPGIDLDFGTGWPPFVNGVIYILLGVITILVSFGLLGGSRVSRGLVTFFLILSIWGAVVQLVHQQILGGVLQLVVGILGILLLWAGRATTFFAR